MKIDIWDKSKYSGVDAVYADCYFSDADCIYRGNVYNSAGEMIGDYSCTDSVKIEKRFPGIFGN